MLDWNLNQTEIGIIHKATLIDTSEHDIREALEACTEKAISNLKTIIQDDSLYLLFEWNPIAATLDIVVTDAGKTRDAHESVNCNFSGLARELERHPENINETAESIKFWLHDYLTTCTSFFSYSLVAIFHNSTRSNTELL